jgi:hypothetical protein
MSGMNHFRISKNSEKRQLGRNNEAFGTEVLQMEAVKCSAEKPQFTKLLKIIWTSCTPNDWYHINPRGVGRPR